MEFEAVEQMRSILHWVKEQDMQILEIDVERARGAQTLYPNAVLSLRLNHKQQHMAAELLFSRLEYWLLEKSPEINLYLEYSSREIIDHVWDLCRERGVKALHMEIAGQISGDKHNACAIFTLRLHKKRKIEMLLPVVAAADDVVL